MKCGVKTCCSTSLRCPFKYGVDNRQENLVRLLIEMSHPCGTTRAGIVTRSLRARYAFVVWLLLSHPLAYVIFTVSH